MGSYLGPEDAVWIDCRPEEVSQSINAFAKYKIFTHYPATPDAIATAIHSALSLSTEERIALAKRGRNAVEARFGQSRFENDFHTISRDVLV